MSTFRRVTSGSVEKMKTLEEEGHLMIFQLQLPSCRVFLGRILKCEMEN